MLPREHRVLKETGVAEVLERLTGLTLGADDLRLILSGCLVERPAPSDGRQWGGGWRAVTIGPERVAYLRVQNGQPVLTAADYGPWRIDYSAHSAGFPRIVRVRRSGDTAIDISARVEQLQVNTAINPLAWVVEIPSDADPMIPRTAAATQSTAGFGPLHSPCAPVASTPWTQIVPRGDPVPARPNAALTLG